MVTALFIVAAVAFIIGGIVGYSAGYEAGFNDQEDESYTDRIAGLRTSRPDPN